MALKDWKKIKGLNRWSNKKDYHKHIDIFRFEKNDEYVYSVWSEKKILKENLSKAQALKYAKNYMRKH